MNTSTIACLALGTMAALAQTQPTLNCETQGSSGNRARSCQMREQTIPSSGQLTIDGGQNGGVSVHGSNRSDVLVRARIEAWGPTDADAQAVAAQIRLNASAGKINSEGPGDRNWAVSYEVFVPSRSDVHAITHNGGVHVSDITGRIEFSAVNGGVHLANLNGHVQGKTTNGGVHIQFSGSRWDGDGMDVTTTNGGVHLSVPDGYSARLETSSVNGGFHASIPLTVSGRVGKQVTATLGSGGALIHVATTNGAVHVDRI